MSTAPIKNRVFYTVVRPIERAGGKYMLDYCDGKAVVALPQGQALYSSKTDVPELDSNGILVAVSVPENQVNRGTSPATLHWGIPGHMPMTAQVAFFAFRPGHLLLDGERPSEPDQVGVSKSEVAK